MGPVAAAIPAIVGVGSSLYGMYQQNKARQKADEQMKAQTAQANQINPYGHQYMNQSQQAIGPTLSYYTSMLANPREATAPEQNRISSMYAGQAANARAMAPRGGGMGPSAAEGIRSQERSAQAGVVQGARPMAAGALGSLGMGLGSLGNQTLGLGSGILANVFNQGISARQQQMQAGQNIGSGLFNSYQAYLLGNAMKDPGGAAAGTQSTPWSMPRQNTAPQGPGGGWPLFGNTGSPMAGSGLYGGTLPNSGQSGPR